MIFALPGIICIKTEAQLPSPSGLLTSYYPAFCRPAVYPTPSCELVIFRQGEQRDSIELPLRLEFLDFARSGTSLYALSGSRKPFCVDRIEINPVRVTRTVCPAGLTVVFAITVSGDEARLLVSGEVKTNGSIRCGIFEILLADGTTSQILNADDCASYTFDHSWTSLSLSPDSFRGIAVRRNRLELFQLDNTGTRVIAEGIAKASWSPDGRWIAALDVNGRTRLIDIGDFKKRRTLMESEVRWSPDSRYLLRVKPCAFPIAVNGVGTLQALDIATGKSVTIESSRCSVDNGSVGWVSIAFAPHY